MKKLITLFITASLLGFSYTDAEACTIIVVGKKASKDGSVIISHTDCGDDSRIRVVPGSKFENGAMAPVHWGIQRVDLPLDDFGEVIGQIPQVEKTYSYIHSAYPHINEHQLAIGESTMSMRDELKFERDEGEQIMTVEQAQIFALQRCTKAEEAVKLIGELMETYGFLPSCIGESESLVIADSEEAWIFEVVGVGPGWKKDSGEPGAIWAAKRVPDDHALVLPNWSIIKEIDTTKTNCMASSNYKSFAEDKGWFDSNDDKPFNWQKIYSPTPREWATGRFWLFYSEVAPNYTDWPKRDLSSPFDTQNPYIQYVEDLDMYPFSLKPEMKLGVEDVMDFQRSVGKGTIYDMSEDPDWYVPGEDGKMEKSPLATPFPRNDMRKLLDITHRRNVARGGYGMICQLRSWLPDAIGGVYWVYQDNQTIGPYAPIYAGVTEINPLYKTYDPDKFDENSARWNYDFVDNLMYLKWQEAWKDVKPVRDSLEQATFEEMKEIDRKAAQLYKKDPELAKEFLTNYSSKKMEELVEAYKELRKVLITKYTNNKQGINF